MFYILISLFFLRREFYSLDRLQAQGRRYIDADAAAVEGAVAVDGDISFTGDGRLDPWTLREL